MVDKLPIAATIIYRRLSNIAPTIKDVFSSVENSSLDTRQWYVDRSELVERTNFFVCPPRPFPVRKRAIIAEEVVHNCLALDSYLLSDGSLAEVPKAREARLWANMLLASQNSIAGGGNSRFLKQGSFWALVTYLSRQQGKIMKSFQNNSLALVLLTNLACLVRLWNACSILWRNCCFLCSSCSAPLH